MVLPKIQYKHWSTVQYQGSLKNAKHTHENTTNHIHNRKAYHGFSIDNLDDIMNNSTNWHEEINNNEHIINTQCQITEIFN